MASNAFHPPSLVGPCLRFLVTISAKPKRASKKTQRGKPILYLFPCPPDSPLLDLSPLESRGRVTLFLGDARSETNPQPQPMTLKANLPVYEDRCQDPTSCLAEPLSSLFASRPPTLRFSHHANCGNPAATAHLKTTDQQPSSTLARPEDNSGPGRTISSALLSLTLSCSPAPVFYRNPEMGSVFVSCP